ncbi:MAG: hypothetical protein ACRDY1_15080 [Acidimicrobiales bacterium]
MTKFGVQLPNFSGVKSAELFDHVVGLATGVEEAGFDSVCVMDHFFQLPALGGPDQPMTPLILTASEQHTAEMRDILAASGAPDDVAGFTIGRPDQIPELVASHIGAGADEVIFSLPFGDRAGIAAVGEALRMVS